MNHKFEVGNIVKVLQAGYGCGSNEVGRLVRITGIGDYDGDPGYKVDPPIGNTLTNDFDGFIGEESFKLHKS